MSLFKEGGCQRIAFSGDSAAFASTNGSEIRTWDITGKHMLGTPALLRTLGSPTSTLQTRSLHTIPLSLKVTHLSFTTDNASILAAAEYQNGNHRGKGLARLWDVQTGKPAGPVITWDLEKDHESATFRPDGAAVAIADYNKGNARLIDMRTGQLMGDQMSLGRPGNWDRPAFGPDNQIIAFLFDGHLKVYDANTARLISSSSPGPEEAPRGYWPFFSRDGHTLFSQDPWAFYLWDINTHHGHAIDGPIAEEEPTFQPFDTGSIAVVNQVSECLILDTQTARCLRPERVYQYAFDPKGLNLALSLFVGPMDRRREPQLFDTEFWSLAPVEGPLDMIRQWSELIARAESREANQVRALDEPTWQDRRRSLQDKLRGLHVSEIVQRCSG